MGHEGIWLAWAAGGGRGAGPSESRRDHMPCAKAALFKGLAGTGGWRRPFPGFAACLLVVLSLGNSLLITYAIREAENGSIRLSSNSLL
jgi:hypothetical protein